jgi:hypothetical protein
MAISPRTFETYKKLHKEHRTTEKRSKANCFLGSAAPHKGQFSRGSNSKSCISSAPNRSFWRFIFSDAVSLLIMISLSNYSSVTTALALRGYLARKMAGYRSHGFE